MNRDKPDQWKSDIARSVDMFNTWFMEFAPQAFRETREQTANEVRNSLSLTRNLTKFSPMVLRDHPEILPTLRMSTCPPLAVDRLVGLADVSKNLVHRMERDKKLPVRTNPYTIEADLTKIVAIIEKMADPDIFVWLDRPTVPPTELEVRRAATIVADRLCGSVANPIIRNAQEKRQLAAIKAWLEDRGYQEVSSRDIEKIGGMSPGYFCFRLNVPVNLKGAAQHINIPIDAVIQPRKAAKSGFPVLIEAKSAGDYTNTNKRRKEEAVKMAQLRDTFGKDVHFILLLCGYFDSGYLGYEAAEGIDWVWEHRIDDLAGFGL
ncbi:MAG: XamI family restriction endonuclease [Caldilineales bacterium]|nr:XamI family restriction endonuclease [Caldilineales bacterium]